MKSLIRAIFLTILSVFVYIKKNILQVVVGTALFIFVLLGTAIGLYAVGTPTATEVLVTGTPSLGEVLTGSYNYTDVGGTWQNEGAAGFSAGLALYPDLVLDNNDLPYVTYSDGENGYKVTAKKYNSGTSAWIPAGSIVSAGSAFYLSMAVDEATNVPYIAYEDFYFEPVSKATLKKYDALAAGNEIQTINFSEGGASGTYTISFDDGVNPVQTTGNIAFLASADTVELAMEALSNIGSGNIKAYGGSLAFGRVPISLEFVGSLAGLSYASVLVDCTNLIPDTDPVTASVSEDQAGGVIGSWVDVGTPGFSDGELSNTSLAIDSNSVPYVAYSDFEHSYKLTVKKFNGANWVDAGNTHFSDGQVTGISLKVDNNDIPHVAYIDYHNGGIAIVMKYNSGTNLWEQLGSPVAGSSNVENISLAINEITNVPYLAYRDSSLQKAVLKKFNGTAWVSVGSSISDGDVGFLDMAIDGDGLPYVSYQDRVNGYGITSKKYISDSWVNLGANSFSIGQVSFVSTAINSNNIPYVSFRDSTEGEKITVMKYDTDLEGTSTYKWYRDGTEISGAISQVHTIVSSDQGKTIKFEVTPISQGAAQGSAVQSSGTAIQVAAGGGGSSATPIYPNSATITTPLVDDQLIIITYSPEVLIPLSGESDVEGISYSLSTDFNSSSILPFQGSLTVNICPSGSCPFGDYEVWLKFFSSTGHSLPAEKVIIRYQESESDNGNEDNGNNDGDEINEVVNNCMDDRESFLNIEKGRMGVVSSSLSNRLSGQILLQVEDLGRAWYMYPKNLQRYYLGCPQSTLNIMRELSLGISNNDLEKIPVGLIDIDGNQIDTDGDGLADNLEVGLGTDPNNPDTDGDGHNDKEEILNNYNPLTTGKTNFDLVLVDRLRGGIYLQVEGRGEAWYINPTDGYRYYLGYPDDASRVMKKLSLGITNQDLSKLKISD